MFGFFNAQDSNNYNEILNDLKSGNASLIDIREAGEWSQVHFQCATHLPLSGLQNGIGLDQIQRLVRNNKKLYLHCRSGSRVQFAKKMLEKMGLKDVNAIPIGMQSMLQKGFQMAA